MELSYQIVEILKEFSSETRTPETHPMTLTEIRNRLVIKIGGNRGNLSDVLETDLPTRKMVRTSIAVLLDTEAMLPEKQKTIMYSQHNKNGKLRKSNYWYRSPISDSELKFLVDSTLYANIINEDNSRKLAKYTENVWKTFIGYDNVCKLLWRY